jgi:hypothetical protein
MLGSSLLPLFILVFLILCFVVFLWLRKRELDNKPVEPKAKHRLPNKEGFQTIAATSYSGNTYNASAGSYVPSLSIWSGSEHTGSQAYISQLDGNDPSYGDWPKTPYDDFYDAYEKNELDATAKAVAKLKDLSVKSKPVPSYGSTLGAFDSDTTTIPWDADNKSSNQEDIVWGSVSQQASKSIFLKTWLQTLIADSERMEPCGEASAHYCYTAPLLQVTVNDPITAAELQQGEMLIQAVGQAVQMQVMGAVVGNGEGTFMERYRINKEIISTSPKEASILLKQVTTILTQASGGLTNSVGFRKMSNLAHKVYNRMIDGYKAMIALTKAAVELRATIAMSTSQATAAALWASSFIVPTNAALALAATLLATAITWFFGIFQLLLMAIEAILQPIVNAGFKVGGVCPPNSNRISNILPPAALTFLVDFIPLGSFLTMFDPFVCWSPDGSIHLMTPPKIPPFMADRTLSVIYHPSWTLGNIMTSQSPNLSAETNKLINDFIAGRAPNIPAGDMLSVVLDPLPPNYKYLPDSDLAGIASGTLQANSQLLQWAKSHSSTISSSSSTADSTVDRPASLIAVETCPAGTTPSTDGYKCLTRTYNTNVSQATMTACETTQFDDGLNCWTTTTSQNGCTGGEITFGAGTTWDDTNGYQTFTVTQPTCATGTSQGGSVARAFNDRITCESGYEKDVGVPLCYAKCQSGYTRTGAICKSSTATRDRKYMFATHSMYYDQPYTPETLHDISDIKIPYCDFSSSVMLDRMANFYYTNSLNNPIVNDDGTIQIQMITRFMGVVASSELSCDVACEITFITYDPITGANYSAYKGCSYQDDEEFNGCPFCYRRFYFILGPNDEKGQFTVTGCTFQDYTAPDAMVKSSDVGANLVPSLPKTFIEYDKSASIFDAGAIDRELKSGKILQEAAFGELNVGVMLLASKLGGAAGQGAAAGIRVGGAAAATAARGALSLTTAAAKNSATELSSLVALRAAAKGGGAEAVAAAEKAINTFISRAGMVGELAGGVGGGIGGQYMNEALTKATQSAIEPTQIINTADTYITGTDMYNLKVMTNDNWWTVDQGPVYELAPGYIPKIDFCGARIIGNDHCTHKYVIRDMVDKYHNEYQESHMKYITAIEPRGKDGCYYKFVQVLYDPNTNLEGVEEIETELILKHEIKDYSTCTYQSTKFTADMFDPNYPIRSYVDPTTANTPTQKFIYPTRDTVYTSDLYARYVRVKCAATNGYLNLSQIAVFDVSGFNISVKQPVYATSTNGTGISAASVVSGSINTGTTSANVWIPNNPSSTSEYWEVDLGKNINISEVVYIGGSLNDNGGAGSRILGRNINTQIQFLYTNGINDTPIYTINLPTDDPIQYIPVFSSSYTTPIYPIAGPIMIPRPTVRGLLLGVNYGCVNKCEDRDVMTSLMSQFNTNPLNANKQIIKALNGLTTKDNACEYKVETMTMLTPDTTDSDGNVVPGKRTIQTEYINMAMSAPTTESVVISHSFARYVRIIPSFKPGTVLEFSKVNVWNAVPDGTTGKKKPGYNISEGKPTAHFNNLYALDVELPDEFDTDPMITAGGSTPETLPHIFCARDNNPATYFEIDLLGTVYTDVAANSCIGNNYEIYQIEFVGRSDRMLGGIQGIQIELYADQPNDQEHCCDGTYPPVYRYIIPSDETYQMITVKPPAKCSFQIQSSTLSPTPVYLTENSQPLLATDTSGGVFSFSGFLDSMKATWNNLIPMKSTDLTAPITQNLKQSDTIVKGILETVAAAQTIAGTSKKCSDTDVMSAMMTAYNIARGPKDTDEFSVSKSTMNRILKSGQSTPSTCDVLFESIDEDYDDYIQDITDPTMRETTVKGVRFIMNAVGGIAVPARDAPGSTPKNILDLSSNSLGIMAQAGNLPTVFTGPSYAVNCRDPTILSSIKAKLEQNVKTDASHITRSTYTSVTGSFQSTPLSCEYMMLRDDLVTYKNYNTTKLYPGNTTYVKALFSLGTDGKTTTMTSVKEYSPEEVTTSQDKTKYLLNGIEVDLPSIFDYEHAIVKSSRVNIVAQGL